MKFDHVAVLVPDIAEAVAFWKAHLSVDRVLYQDASWAFLEVGGAKFAFVLRDQHPGHIAFRVEDGELDGLAAQHGQVVKVHRDRTRSFYLQAPGGQSLEVISYPPEATVPV